MEFPFNHGPRSNATHTHHHHQRNDDEEEYPPPGNAFSSFDNPHQPPPPQPHYPPPGNAFSSFNNNPHQPPPPQPHQPFYADSYPPPQPPQPETQVFHSSHVSSGHVSQDFNYSAPPPPPPSHHHHQPDHSLNLNYGYPPTPTPTPPVSDYSTPVPNATVRHVSHETHHPHFPTSSSVHHVSHQVPNLTAPPPLFTNKPTFRVVTKAAPNYSLTIRRGEVVLAPSDPSDQYQHWYKDEKYSTRVKDTEGCPAFSLVNKVTGEAIKHSIGGTHPVRLIRYNPDYLDQSILWTESRDLGGGYRAIRMVNNVHLNVDAFHGDKQSGGVHDGTTIVLWEWNKGDNQQWKILPYCKFSIHNINQIPSKSLLCLFLLEMPNDFRILLSKDNFFLREIWMYALFVFKFSCYLRTFYP